MPPSSRRRAAAVMLIDGGGVRDGSFDTGARIVEPFLRARGIGRIDIVALSHPHPDHLNGLFRVLERFERRRVLVERRRRAQPRVPRLVALARGRGVAIPQVAEARLGAAAIVPLGPFETFPDGARDRIAAPPGLERQRRLARGARRVRGPRRAVRRRSRGRWRGRAGRAARCRAGGRRRRAQGPPSRQPHIVDARSWSTPWLRRWR